MSLQKLMTENISASRERKVRSGEIDSYDFTKSNSSHLHSSQAPIVPQLDIEIDPELDLMLAELEQDSEFSSLGENEQKAWLESLFFQDTMHAPGRMPRDQLSKTKAQKKNTLRVNQDQATRLDPVEPKQRTSNVVEDPEITSAVHVNDKLSNLAQDFFKVKSSPSSSVQTKRPSVTSLNSRKSPSPPDCLPSPSVSRKSSLSFGTPPTSRKTSIEDKRGSSIDDSMGEISGVKQNLCSLAQSYFQATPTSKPTKTATPVKEETWEEERKRRDEEEKIREEQAAKEEKQKASLVASFFGGAKPTPKPKSQPVQPVQPAKVMERASYEPSGNGFQAEDEDDEIEKLIRDAERERQGLPPLGVTPASSGPPPPPRSGDTRALAMMKRLNNVNNIMAGKKPISVQEEED